jgi:hypothetical protein
MSLISVLFTDHAVAKAVLILAVEIVIKQTKNDPICVGSRCELKC